MIFISSSCVKKKRLHDVNIVAKRTNGEGISVLYFDSVVGQAADREYEMDDIIRLN